MQHTPDGQDPIYPDPEVFEDTRERLREDIRRILARSPRADEDAIVTWLQDALTAEERSWYGFIVEPAPASQFALYEKIANSRLLTLSQKLAFCGTYDAQERQAILRILDSEREQLLDLIRAVRGP